MKEEFEKSAGEAGLIEKGVTVKILYHTLEYERLRKGHTSRRPSAQSPPQCQPTYARRTDCSHFARR